MPLLSRILFGLVVALPLSVLADDWNHWRGPDRNGISRETNWIDTWTTAGPKLIWKARVGTGFSSIVVSENRLFTVGNSDDIDTVHCFDASTGNLVWKHSYPCPLDDRFFEGGPTSTPTVDGSRLFILSRTGDAMCLDAKTGAVHWSKNLPEETGADVPGWGFAGSPIVLDERLFLSVGQSGTALDKSTGEVLWKSEGEAGYMTPLPLRGLNRPTIVIASGKFYHGVDPATGEVQWRQRWLTTFGCNAADPIAHNQQLFISSGYNRGSALLDLSVTPPSILWETKEYQNQWSSSVLVNGYLYGVDGDDTGERSFKCLELESGKISWSFEGLGSASVLAAGERLIVLSDQGELVIAPASHEEFKPTARSKVLDGKCWTVPTLANGLLYCRSAAGDMICVDFRKPQ